MTDGEDQERPRCGAKRRGIEETCRQWPMRGGTRCRNHGGASPQAKAKAADNLAVTRAERFADRYLRKIEIVPVTNPLEELAKLAGIAVAWQQVMQKLVDDLDQLRYRAIDTEQVRGEVLLFERSMDRAASVLAMMAKLDIENRLVKITDRQAEAVEKALLAAMYEMRIDPERMEPAMLTVAKHLRAVS
jgi:hypothetical protein